MSDLVEFLKARLAEDEAKAKTALPYWEHETDYDLARLYIETQDHVRHFTPERTLREVRFKRDIIAEHQPNEHHADVCGTCDPGSCGCSFTEYWPCPILRHLAAIYDWHPDYRAEWAS